MAYTCPGNSSIDGLGVMQPMPVRKPAPPPPSLVAAQKAIETAPGALNEIVDSEAPVINARQMVIQRIQDLERAMSPRPLRRQVMDVGRGGNKIVWMNVDTPTEYRGRWQGPNVSGAVTAEKHLAQALKEYERVRKQVLNRISNPIPYKGHVIRPVVKGNDIEYQVTFDISGKRGTFNSPEEAKAAVDNEVALGPGGIKAKDEFEALAQRVGEEQAALLLAKKHQAPQAPGQAASSQAQGMSTAAKLAIGAAAVGGAVLLLR